VLGLVLITAVAGGLAYANGWLSGHPVSDPQQSQVVTGGPTVERLKQPVPLSDGPLTVTITSVRTNGVDTYMDLTAVNSNPGNTVYFDSSCLLYLPGPNGTFNFAPNSHDPAKPWNPNIPPRGTISEHWTFDKPIASTVKVQITMSCYTASTTHYHYGTFSFTIPLR
jgi:hypothetical protein